jgi:hypothetical protein
VIEDHEASGTPLGFDFDETLVAVDEATAYVEAHPVPEWVGVVCAGCGNQYGTGVQMPIVVLDGVLPAKYFDSDACASRAGYLMAVRLRAMLQDYVLGHVVVVDGSGAPVDPMTFEKYAGGERRFSPIGAVDAGDPTQLTAAAREFFEYLRVQDDLAAPAPALDLSSSVQAFVRDGAASGEAVPAPERES